MTETADTTMSTATINSGTGRRRVTGLRNGNARHYKTTALRVASRERYKNSNIDVARILFVGRGARRNLTIADVTTR